MLEIKLFYMIFKKYNENIDKKITNAHVYPKSQKNKIMILVSFKFIFI